MLASRTFSVYVSLGNLEGHLHRPLDKGLFNQEKYFQFHSVQSSQTSFSAAACRDKSLNMPNVPEYN